MFLRTLTVVTAATLSIAETLSTISISGSSDLTSSIPTSASTLYTTPTTYTTPTVSTSVTVASSIIATSASATTTASASTSSLTVVVNLDGSAQFTAVNSAILYAQQKAIPTVYVKAGTYNEALTVNGSAAVTIVGETTTSDDYSQNKVTISTDGVAMTINTNAVKNTVWKNINFITTSTASPAYAVSLRGTKNAFYNCQIISGGSHAVYSTLGITLIANSYVEATTKTFAGYLGMYIFGSTITATATSNGVLLYNQGYDSINSQVVFDSCTITQKSGATNQNVYLALPNGNYAQGMFKNTYMSSMVIPQGVYSYSASYTNDFYGEYNNSGAGSYAQNSASRTSLDNLMSVSQLSSWTIGSVFANSWTAYATTDLSWIDSSVLAAINAVAAANAAASSSAPSVISTTSLSSASSTVSISAFNATSTSAAVSSTSATTCPTATLVVNQTPDNTCEYATISSAVAALASDGLAKTIVVQPGSYNEQVTINRSGKVTLIGNTTFPNDFTQNTVTVWFDYGVSTSAGQDELTPVLNSKKSDLAVHNINFHNTFEQTYNYAGLAADFYGSNMAFYGCSFIGYQDTLLLNKGIQVLSNCYIEGSVDFIWGFSTAFLHGCYIAANTAGDSVCAQSRSSSTAAGGYVIDSSLITYTSSYGSTMGETYLARPYSEYSRVVYTNSYLDSHINAAGWSVWSKSSPQTDGVTFGEYNNVGPSSSTASRASFSTQLNETAAEAYTLGNWIGDTSWINMTAYKLVPSYSWTNSSATKLSGTTTATASATASSTASSTASASATATCGHPASGTEIPVGAVVVDASNATSGSYHTLTLALAALPQDSTCQEVFILPGTYVEQASVNRPGQTVIIGYTTASPGRTYEGNQVTISYSRGLDVSVSQPGHSDAETAVISTASSNIAFYNVNFDNTANSDGAISSYVTLAASIYGNHIGFYGCSFVGWQDTLLTGATSGYQYYESCYIEGAIDFIWGYSAAYFKGCTIAAKKKTSCITAHSRASSSAIGAYVFDECLVTAASGYSSSLEKKVYLGRPYSKYAKVVYKNSYLDSVVNPAGWKIWSKSDPRTDYITFAEFNNSGAGNWENNEAARVGFGNSTLLTSDTYPITSVLDSTSWIDMTYWDSITTPSDTTTTTPSTTSQANSTVPAAGDYIVSKTAIDGKTTYSNFTDVIAAIASISSSKTVTVFVYPGVYEEQLVFSRSGTTIFRGYSESPDDNTQNQVIIQNSYGVNTQADQSNSDSATLYSRAKYLQMYNINLNNVFGTTHDYASLGFAIGNDGYASFYDCQITGNQDTFDLNSGTSVFAYNTLVEGSIDFIWGAGSAYFLNSTIVPNADDGSITADKRATNTSSGGLVFDQCTVAAASGVSSGSIYLGRPYNQYARVAWVNSYLDSSINPAGWSVWSKSNPQTSNVVFGEYHNYGPGASNSSRASFSEQLSDSDVVQFQLANFFSSQGTSWINMTYVDVVPFVAGT